LSTFQKGAFNPVFPVADTLGTRTEYRKRYT